MKSIKIIFIGVFIFLFTQTKAQENTENNWKSGRPNGHAPISIMGDHYHSKGEVMFS